jgi:IclR family transcriptional regulator, acetate operon repressor
MTARAITRAAAAESTATPDPAPAGGSRYEIAVVADALRLISEIAHHGDTTTSAAATLLGLSRSTAYRILVTLENQGFVDRASSSGGWVAGPQLGRTIPHIGDDRLKAVAAPSLRLLLAEQQETVNLAVYAKREVRFFLVLESPLPFRMSNTPGERASFHASALGKAILVALPVEERTRVLERLPLERLTARTITSREALVADLERCRERGWSEAHGETSLGVACFGAAMRGPDGNPIGALSVSVPDARLGPQRNMQIGRRVMEEAAKISANLGFTARSEPGA